MIDTYFKKPVLWDYILGVAVASGSMLLYKRKLISLPKEDYLYSVVSDISTISLTLAGFILTLLTVLISYKSTAKKITTAPSENDSVYDVFFSTQLYFETIKHLKNAIKSLTLLALAGYLLKLTLSSERSYFLFSYNSLAITIVCLTLWRCLLILSKIVKLQQAE